MESAPGAIEKIAEAAAASKNSWRFGPGKDACMPTFEGDVTMLDSAPLQESTTSAHAERLRVPRIHKDALLAAKCPPPTYIR